jgi:sulfite reductase alpha subunit-like flavoprotein
MKDHKPKLKLFFSRQEAKRYIQEELGTTENEIMIIPRCEVTDE